MHEWMDGQTYRCVNDKYLLFNKPTTKLYMSKEHILFTLFIYIYMYVYIYIFINTG